MADADRTAEGESGSPEPRELTGALARPVTRRAALRMSGAVGAATIAPGAWPAGPAATAATFPDSPRAVSAVFVSDLFGSIARQPYANRSIAPRTASRLARRLMAPVDGPEAIAVAVRALYALSARSFEAVLTECRGIAASVAIEHGGTAQAREYETDVSAAVSDLNELCVTRFGVPVHRAALSGKTTQIDASEPPRRLAALLFEDLMQRPRPPGAPPPTLPSCVGATYPRYVASSFGPGRPWDLKPSSSQTARPEETACHVRMNYPHVVKAWVGMTPAVYCVVHLNGWARGLRLAADGQALFVKAWTLVPYGFVPSALGDALWTRSPPPDRPVLTAAIRDQIQRAIDGMEVSRRGAGAREIDLTPPGAAWYIAYRTGRA